MFHRKRDDQLTVLERLERRRKRWTYFLLTFLLFFGLIGVGLTYAFVTYTVYAEDLVSPERLLNRHFRGLIIYDKNSSIIYESEGTHEVGNVSIGDVPEYVKNATLAVEDADFYEHEGFSWSGIMRSVLLNFQNNNPYAYGGSTITQQLVKNALLDDRSKSYQRKFKEIILAVGVDKRYSKDQILEMYLNSSYYGRGAYGIGNAAKIYFDVAVNDLTLAQASYLAGLPKSPSTFATNLALAKDRQAYVLSRMQEEGLVNAQDAEIARNTELTFAQNEVVRGKYPFFSLYVRDRILETYGEHALEQSGYRVFTTLDPRAQGIAEETVYRQVNNLAKNRASNGAAVVMNPKSGALLAIVGSADWNNDAIDGKFNVALSPQQPGSSFKPFIYLRALERGIITAATQLSDSPTSYPGGYSPKNYDGKFRGKVTTRRALANSLNLPAVQVMEKVGLVDAVSYAKNLGVRSLGEPSNYGLSLVLGGAEVTPLDMTSAYATLANGGFYNEPYAIERIVDKYGQTIYTHKPEPVRVADERAVYIISDILSDNNARQEIFGPTSLKLSSGRPAAVKTGTTDEYRDAWTMGYTPSLVVGVWVGNNNNTPMDSVAGSLGPAPAWKGIMEGVLGSSPFEQFERPAGVEYGEMCSLVEKKVNENGAEKVFYEFSTRRELFISGTNNSNCNAIRKEVEELQQQQDNHVPPEIMNDSPQEQGRRWNHKEFEEELREQLLAYEKQREEWEELFKKERKRKDD